MTKIGDNEIFTQPVRFTQEEVNQFADVTGDKNPIHLDAAYAAKTPFGRPIVHGFLVGSVFSKVFGTKWPGEGTIYLFQKMSFMAPVFVDTDYTAKFEVKSVDREKHRAVIHCLIEDEEGKIVLEGDAKVLNTKRF